MEGGGVRTQVTEDSKSAAAQSENHKRKGKRRCEFQTLQFIKQSKKEQDHLRAAPGPCVKLVKTDVI